MKRKLQCCYISISQWKSQIFCIIPYEITLFNHVKHLKVTISHSSTFKALKVTHSNSYTFKALEVTHSYSHTFKALNVTLSLSGTFKVLGVADPNSSTIRALEVTNQKIQARGLFSRLHTHPSVRNLLVRNSSQSKNRFNIQPKQKKLARWKKEETHFFPDAKNLANNIFSDINSADFHIR